MSAFKGYLLKAVSTNEVFPLKYMQFNTYKATPNQREELKAYRDDNSRNLTRVTASGKKSKIEFKIRSSLHLEDKMKIQSWFYRAESNHEQRKITLEFWDDENNTYKRGDFYRSNQQYQIIRIEDDDIIYGELDIVLVEY